MHAVLVPLLLLRRSCRVSSVQHPLKIWPCSSRMGCSLSVMQYTSIHIVTDVYVSHSRSFTQAYMLQKLNSQHRPNISPRSAPLSEAGRKLVYLEG